MYIQYVHTICTHVHTICTYNMYICTYNMYICTYNMYTCTYNMYIQYVPTYVHTICTYICTYNMYIQYVHMYICLIHAILNNKRQLLKLKCTDPKPPNKPLHYMLVILIHGKKIRQFLYINAF
jgi:hypothetical protein